MKNETKTEKPMKTKTVCAWCLAETGTAPKAGDSHGICQIHFDRAINQADAQAHYERRLKVRQQMARVPGAVQWPDLPAPASKPVLGWFLGTVTATAALIGAWLWRVM